MESLGTEARGEREARTEREARKEREKREAREEREGRLEAKERGGYWRREEKRSIFIKKLQKRVKSSFLLRIMLKMLHFNANRNLFCNFVLRTAVITKFSFPKI